MAWQPPSTSCSHASLEASYSYLSSTPAAVLADAGTECILGVDEAGRGPVLGPMVYGVSYCSVKYADSIKPHGFMDSKVLDHNTRVDLLRKVCDSEHELYKEIGWTVRVMSARDIGAGMLRPVAPYNLNAQAHDTTIQLIRDILNQGVNVRKIFVDTVGIAESYQAKLQREFPMAEVTVCKKADSIYPIVSVASICAKVTRDKALEMAVPRTEDKENEPPTSSDVPDLVEEEEETAVTDRVHKKRKVESDDEDPSSTTSLQKEQSFVDEPSSGSWGSGYPSDARTQNWLKSHAHPIFGWRGSMVRYSWSTVKDLLEGNGKMVKDKKAVVLVDWHEQDDGEDGQQTLSFGGSKKDGMTVNNWFGTNVGARGFKA